MLKKSGKVEERQKTLRTEAKRKKDYAYLIEDALARGVRTEAREIYERALGETGIDATRVEALKSGLSNLDVAQGRYEREFELPVVSLDDVRRELGVSWEDRQGPVVAAALGRARVLLRKKQPFVWNATCLIPDFRKRELQLFRDYGACTEILIMETPWGEMLRRNRNRKAVVPEMVIGDMLDRFSPPSVREAHSFKTIVT